MDPNSVPIMLNRSVEYGNITVFKPRGFANGFVPKLYLGKSLNYFFNHALINVYQIEDTINILDFFPLLKQGIASSETVEMLLYIYIQINKVRLNSDNKWITTDELFNTTFGGTIAAEIYIWLEDYNYQRIEMQKALSDGLITNLMNTFEVLKILELPFDINRSYIARLVNMNCYELTEVDSQKIINELNEELKLSHALAHFIIYLKDKNKGSPIQLRQLIKPASNSAQCYIINHLIGDRETTPDLKVLRQRIKLLYAIYNIDIVILVQYLNNLHIRLNIGYLNAALETGNFQIIEIIKDRIVRTYWIETQAITKSFEELIGPSDIPKCILTLINHYNNI